MSEKTTSSGEAEAAGPVTERAPESEIAADESAASKEGVAAAETETPDKDAEICALRAEADDFRDRWMRAAAALENFRRRTAREHREHVVRASERILNQVLEPVDNLERAIRATKTDDAPTVDEKLAALAQGIEMVYQQFMTMLASERVTPMESVGAPFDPQLHDAMMIVEREDVDENTIVEEIRRGYMLGERVLRHAQVVVSKAPAPSDEPRSEETSIEENAEQTG